MLTRPAGHEAKAEAEARKSDAEAGKCMRPRLRPAGTLENTVCMSMKTKILF